MSKTVFIKQNSPEIRERLKEARFSICACAEFEDAIWLIYHPDNNELKYEIHGIGYTDPSGMEELSPEERIKAWLSEDGYFSQVREFCDTVEEFLKHYKK